MKLAIQTDNPTISEAVQRVLFGLGYRWEMSPETVQHTSSPYLVAYSDTKHIYRNSLVRDIHTKIGPDLAEITKLLSIPDIMLGGDVVRFFKDGSLAVGIEKVTSTEFEAIAKRLVDGPTAPEPDRWYPVAEIKSRCREESSGNPIQVINRNTPSWKFSNNRASVSSLISVSEAYDGKVPEGTTHFRLTGAAKDKQLTAGGYGVSFTSNGITVGCQTITFEQFNNIAARRKETHENTN